MTELLEKREMILAYDQGLEHGPQDFKENPLSAMPEHIIEIALDGGFTGLVVHGGIAKRYREDILRAGIPLILKLNGKTAAVPTKDDPYSPLLYGKDGAEAVKWAADLGAWAVGYTVYTGSKYENLMNAEFSQIASAAHNLGLVVIGWMYPRGEKVANDADPELVAYAARIGMELGADIVKVKYTGTVESFREVVQYAHPTKVVMSGGPKTKTPEEFFSQVKDVLAAGAAGVAVGRNVWQRPDSVEFALQLEDIIFNQQEGLGLA